MFHKIKILYTSNTPIILQATLMHQLIVLFSIMGERFDSEFIRWFIDIDPRHKLTGGLIYFITKPDSFLDPFILNHQKEIIRIFT